MGERFIKLQERHSFQPITTAGNQSVPTPVAGRESLATPPAVYLHGRDTELQVTSAPIQTKDPAKARPGSHDPEKGPFKLQLQPVRGVSYSHSRVTYADPEDDVDEDGPKKHAVWIMVGHLTSAKISFTDMYKPQQIYLSALSPLLALPIGLYSLVMGTLLLLLLPLCFCLMKSPICARFRQLFSPLLVFQLGLIYSSYDIGDSVQSATSGILVLVLVSILSPLYSMAIAVATWVAGVFWFYTSILGNPDGKEDRDDGREAVLAVRGLWEKWLIQSLEPADHSPLRDDGSESSC